MPIRLSHGVARPLAAVALAAASLVAAVAVGSIFLSTASDARAALAAAGPASPADGILVAVALVGVVLSLWVGLGLALSALSALPGVLGQACTLLADRMAPAAVRKVVAFVLGTALTAALVPGTAVAGSAHHTATGRGQLGPVRRRSPRERGRRRAGRLVPPRHRDHPFRRRRGRSTDSLVVSGWASTAGQQRWRPGPHRGASR
jgi:hypothetical protein